LKKIALASAAMGGAALIAFGASGTFASFIDTEAATGSAGAGTMDLTVGGGTLTSPTSALSLNPGGKTTLSYWVNNAGTVAGTLTADLSVTDEERGCLEPEQADGDTDCDWAEGGEFSEFANVQFFDAQASTPETCAQAVTGAALTPMMGLRALAATSAAPVGALAAGAGNCYVVAIELPNDARNKVQGDVSQIKVDLTLTQAP
jgi:hypothetical protein